MAKVIAEIGINHSGQLDLAKNLVSMAKEAGADAVKFQKRDVETVYAGELDNPRNDGNPYGWKTVGEQKRGIEFSIEQYEKIDTHCKKVGIPWFASYWDMESAVQMQNRFDPPYNKIASAMVTHTELCEFVAILGKQTFISTGGGTHNEIFKCLELFTQNENRNVVLMHCVSTYPCSDNQLNLNMLHTLRREWPWVQIGYSGHEVGLYPSIMALGMGVSWIERHITIDRSMYGSDQAASMEYNGLKQLCDVAHRAEEILGDGVKRILPEETEVMKKLRYWER